MTNSKTTLRHKDLLQQVSEHSGMFIYEIEDALHSLAVVLAQNLAQGRSCSLQGVGSFSLKSNAPRAVKSGLNGREYKSKGSKSCRFKIDSLMKNALNEVALNAVQAVQFKDGQTLDLFDKESKE